VLRAFAHPENIGSLKVLERLGFLDDRRDIAHGMPVVCYRLRRRHS
jgi:RimJ/RimL family protein N-acetyltransferase